MNPKALKSLEYYKIIDQTDREGFFPDGERPVQAPPAL